MTHALVWLRRDLRLDDQPALRAALEAGHVPLLLYIHAPQEEGVWAPGAASNAWLHHSLQALRDELRARGSDLLLRRGDRRTSAAGSDCANQRASRLLDPKIRARYPAARRPNQALVAREGIACESFNGALLFEPWALATKQGRPYRVFTPYWRAALAQWQTPALWDAPARLPTPTAVQGDQLAGLGLLPSPRWDEDFWAHWQPGEAGAGRR